MFTTVIIFKDDSEDDEDGFDANNDDNDDVTKWRGRERGQIVFYYPSFPTCILWVYTLLYYPSFYVCIIFCTTHHSMCTVVYHPLDYILLYYPSYHKPRQSTQARSDYCRLLLFHDNSWVHRDFTAYPLPPPKS